MAILVDPSREASTCTPTESLYHFSVVNVPLLKLEDGTPTVKPCQVVFALFGDWVSAMYSTQPLVLVKGFLNAIFYT